MNNFNILVDSKDNWLLKTYSFSPVKFKHTSYARANSKLGSKPQINIYLHQAIMGRPLKGLVIDHKNRNGLDSRRKN
ncbi:MAG: hypothetical protein KAS39_08410, partial [Actinomycetia bacterium]|nr:hypothetical protein [Actinomycetes bacterium]